MASLTNEVLEAQNNVGDAEKTKKFTDAVEVKQRQDKKAADSLSRNVH